MKEILDADENPLVDKFGQRMKRDIVQFVPLREFQTRTGANFSLVRSRVLEFNMRFLFFRQERHWQKFLDSFCLL